MVGAGFGVGVVILIAAALAARKPALDVRVLPYLRDLPAASRLSGLSSSAPPLFAAPLASVARWLDKVLGGSASIRRRLERANLDLSVHDFRVQQALWGLIGFAVAAVPTVWWSLTNPSRALPLALGCGAAGLAGVMLRENRLTAQVNARERQMLAVGRALMGQPDLLMLDEPSLGLAPLVVKEIFRTIEKLRATGVTILLVEQNARAALEVADHGYVLEMGEIALEGPADDLARDSRVIDTYLGAARQKTPA